ncbi:MAG: rRNA maturation RNase YbeY [Clostridiales bacterium]|nr:rRNA maturation RNase YbeY [Clostridiales bacterium]
MNVKITIIRKKRGLLMDKQEEKAIRDCIKKTLVTEAFLYPCEVSVSLTDDLGIRELNREFRNMDKATDVLSFPMYEFFNGEPVEDIDAVYKMDGVVMLGDIVLSVERARAQAEEYGHTFLRECGYLTVHSMLHLLGYDHERGDKDKATMRQHEESVLKAFGLLR